MRSRVVAYPCTTCRAPLRFDWMQWRGWVRCPRCGVASLPPEPLEFDTDRDHGDASETGRGPEPSPDHIGDSATRSAPVNESQPGSYRGLLIAGLILRLFLALIAFLDGMSTADWIFRVIAVILAVLLFVRRKPSTRAGRTAGEDRVPDQGA